MTATCDNCKKKVVRAGTGSRPARLGQIMDACEAVAPELAKTRVRFVP